MPMPRYLIDFHAIHAEYGVAASDAPPPACRPSDASGRRGRGQTLVEFAITIMLLAMLLVTVVDLARAFYYDVMVSAAANAGVRAATHGAPDHTHTSGANTVIGVIEATQRSAPQGIICATCVAVTPTQNLRTAGVVPVWTTVTVTYTFQPLTPLMAALLGPSVTIERSASQRMRTRCALADGSPCP